MEARLIHAYEVQTINGEKAEWRIINPLKFGIRVDESQIPAKLHAVLQRQHRPRSQATSSPMLQAKGGPPGRLDSVCGRASDAHYRFEGSDAVLSGGV